MLPRSTPASLPGRTGPGAPIITLDPFIDNERNVNATSCLWRAWTPHQPPTAAPPGHSRHWHKLNFSRADHLIPPRKRLPGHNALSIVEACLGPRHDAISDWVRGYGYFGDCLKYAVVWQLKGPCSQEEESSARSVIVTGVGRSGHPSPKCNNGANLCRDSVRNKPRAEMPSMHSCRHRELVERRVVLTSN